MKTVRDVDYCVRVTADDGSRGEEYLKHFQDNEKHIPTILTTSKKLSTGVDARNVRNIVLLRQVKSMIEFKQIIGRGTRLWEGKYYFTIHDFVNAHELFNDPEWDGTPAEPEPPSGDPRPGPGTPSGPRPERPDTIVVQLPDGKARKIQHMVQTTFGGLMANLCHRNNSWSISSDSCLICSRMKTNYENCGVSQILARN